MQIIQANYVMYLHDGFSDLLLHFEAGISILVWNLSSLVTRLYQKRASFWEGMMVVFNSVNAVPPPCSGSVI